MYVCYYRPYRIVSLPSPGRSRPLRAGPERPRVPPGPRAGLLPPRWRRWGMSTAVPPRGPAAPAEPRTRPRTSLGSTRWGLSKEGIFTVASPLGGSLRLAEPPSIPPAPPPFSRPGLDGPHALARAGGPVRHAPAPSHHAAEAGDRGPRAGEQCGEGGVGLVALPSSRSLARSTPEPSSAAPFP